MKGDQLADAAIAQGFKPFKKKAQSEGTPNTTPLPMLRDKRQRSISDSFLTTKSFRLGSLVELKIETSAGGSQPSPCRAYCSFAEPLPEVSPTTAKGVFKGRRRLQVTLQARRTRCSLSLDPGFALALAFLSFACLAGRAAAYSTRPTAPRFHRPTSSSSPPSAAAATATWDWSAYSPPAVPHAPHAAATAGASSAISQDPVALASASLHQATRAYLNPAEARAVADAVAFAVEAHAGQYRKSGEPYVVHPIETACILAEMKVDADTVVAGLLHDVVEDTDWSTTQLCARFGETVSQIVDGVTDVDYHHHASSPGSSSSSSSDGASPMTKAEAKAAQDAANQQRLLLAMGGSLNVVLVKLADRVHNMRTLGAMPAEKRVKKAKETMELYVPLAATIGVSSLEAELRQLSAQHLSPLGALTDAATRNAAASSKASRGFPFSSPLNAFPALLRQSADESFARITCPALLAEFLVADQALRDANVAQQLQEHRATWAGHCSAVSTSVESQEKEKRQISPSKGGKGGWFSDLQAKWADAEMPPSPATAQLRAAYAAALVAGFANTPAAFGVDAQQTVSALASLLAYH